MNRFTAKSIILLCGLIIAGIFGGEGSAQTRPPILGGVATTGPLRTNDHLELGGLTAIPFGTPASTDAWLYYNSTDQAIYMNIGGAGWIPISSGGGGGGGVSGVGSVNTIPLWGISGSSIGNSALSQSSGAITAANDLFISGILHAGSPTNIITDSSGKLVSSAFPNIADPSWLTSLDGSKLTGTVTATNGVITTGSYVDPSWIVNLNAGKIVGPITASAFAGILPLINGGTGAATKTGSFDALSPLTTLGDILVGTSGGSGIRLPGNTAITKMFLGDNGNGTTAIAPSWSMLSSGDIPSLVASKIAGGAFGVADAGALTNLTAANVVGDIPGNAASINSMLPYTKGGTGQITAPTNTFLVGNGSGWTFGVFGTGLSWDGTTLTGPSLTNTSTYTANGNTITVGSKTNFDVARYGAPYDAKTVGLVLNGGTATCENTGTLNCSDFTTAKYGGANILIPNAQEKALSSTGAGVYALASGDITSASSSLTVTPPSGGTWSLLEPGGSPYWTLQAASSPSLDSGTLTGTIGTNTLTGTGTSFTTLDKIIGGSTLIVDGHTYIVDHIVTGFGDTQLVVNSSLLTSPAGSSFTYANWELLGCSAITNNTFSSCIRGVDATIAAAHKISNVYGVADAIRLYGYDLFDGTGYTALRSNSVPLYSFIHIGDKIVASGNGWTYANPGVISSMDPSSIASVNEVGWFARVIPSATNVPSYGVAASLFLPLAATITTISSGVPSFSIPWTTGANIVNQHEIAWVGHDASAGIQAAIDAASAAGGGTVVFPPTGTFIVDTLVHLKSHVNFEVGKAVLVGNGAAVVYGANNNGGGIGMPKMFSADGTLGLDEPQMATAAGVLSASGGQIGSGTVSSSGAILASSINQWNSVLTAQVGDVVYAGSNGTTAVGNEYYQITNVNSDDLHVTVSPAPRAPLTGQTYNITHIPCQTMSGGSLAANTRYYYKVSGIDTSSPPKQTKISASMQWATTDTTNKKIYFTLLKSLYSSIGKYNIWRATADPNGNLDFAFLRQVDKAAANDSGYPFATQSNRIGLVDDGSVTPDHTVKLPPMVNETYFPVTDITWDGGTIIGNGAISDGIRVTYGSDINVKNLTVLNSGDGGISFVEVENGSIQDCHLNNGGHNILVWNSQHVNVARNKCIKGGISPILAYHTQATTQLSSNISTANPLCVNNTFKDNEISDYGADYGQHTEALMFYGATEELADNDYIHDGWNDVNNSFSTKGHIWSPQFNHGMNTAVKIRDGDAKVINCRVISPNGSGISALTLRDFSNQVKRSDNSNIFDDSIIEGGNSQFINDSIERATLAGIQASDSNFGSPTASTNTSNGFGGTFSTCPAYKGTAFPYMQSLLSGTMGPRSAPPVMIKNCTVTDTGFNALQTTASDAIGCSLPNSQITGNQVDGSANGGIIVSFDRPSPANGLGQGLAIQPFNMVVDHNSVQNVGKGTVNQDTFNTGIVWYGLSGLISNNILTGNNSGWGIKIGINTSSAPFNISNYGATELNNVISGFTVPQLNAASTGFIAMGQSSTANNALRTVITTPYTLSATDETILVNVGSASSITLPSAALAGVNRPIRIKDISGSAATNNITLTRTGSDTIDGGTTSVINTNYGKATLISDGISKWSVF